MTTPVLLITLICGWYVLVYRLFPLFDNMASLQDLSYYDECHWGSWFREGSEQGGILWCGWCLVLHYQCIWPRAGVAALHARAYIK